MKNSILIALMAITFNSMAQITLEHTYSGAASSGGQTFIDVIHLTSSGYKYMVVDNGTQKIRLYNLNHTVFRTISIPAQPQPQYGFSISYVSDQLFNTNASDIEYMISNRNTQTTQKITIYDETGNVLFNQVDSVNNAITRITYTPDGVKMFIFNGNTDSSAYVYNLPGQLPCNDCANGIISGFAANEESNAPEINISNSYPNPATNSTRIDYTLPSGVDEGQIVFYDLNGKELKRFRVDRSFDHLLISTADISSGTYYFQLQTSDQASVGRKLVVIK